MRRKIAAGNWKMNTTIEEGIALVTSLEALMASEKCKCDVIVAPPFTHLYPVASAIADKKSCIALAAQNCAAYESGAYTGEVSAAMLASVGCEYVIIGHSERREYFSEESETLLKKIRLVISNGMNPIYCVGEKLEERESGNHFNVVATQIKEVLFNLDEEGMKRVIVAYEPVWAIGTGKTATSTQAEEMHSFIRRVISEKFPSLAPLTSILYGGSCKPSNASELFAQENVDGGLIGGASLNVNDFIAIIKSF